MAISLKSVQCTLTVRGPNRFGQAVSSVLLVHPGSVRIILLLVYRYSNTSTRSAHHYGWQGTDDRSTGVTPFQPGPTDGLWSLSSSRRVVGRSFCLGRWLFGWGVGGGSGLYGRPLTRQGARLRLRASPIASRPLTRERPATLSRALTGRLALALPLARGHHRTHSG